MTELKIVCEVCSKPVKDGFMYMEYRAMNLHKDAWAEYDRKIDERRKTEGQWVVEKFGDMPNVMQAPWHVLHHSCGGDEPADSPWYWFDIGEDFSYESLLHWTAHLMEKGWLNDTDWQQIIFRAADTGILTSRSLENSRREQGRKPELAKD